MATVLHIKSNKNIKEHSRKDFLCCGEKPTFVDVLSHRSEKDYFLATEVVIKKCDCCGKNFTEETIFGHQDKGYPIIKTFER